MLQYVPWHTGLTIVELGGGRGAMTRSILVKKSIADTFTVCEIQKDRFDDLSKLQNEHTNILHMDAQACMQTFSPGSVDVVVSTLPLGSMNPVHAREILEAIQAGLSEDGIYIQYQYFATNKDDIEKHFHIVSTDWEPLNFPPAFIYVCKKR